jgi:predicted neutral ceramidase superfamily lipid hydrolase
LPTSGFILIFKTPFNILLVKLYAGIFIFLIVSYAIIYIVDRPYNKNFGFHSFDAVSQMMQNWLFDVNTSAPFGQNFGTPTDIKTNTIVFKNQKGQIKSIFFAPDIHYGPAGTLAGSDFPYLLEHYSMGKYKVPTFVMHCAVDMDHNPISSSQFSNLKDAFENGIKNSRPLNKANSFSYTENKYKDSKIMSLGFGGLSLVTMTRAPRVTEDVSLESAVLLNELLETKLGASVLIDAHNSRYESASKQDLDGVKFDSAVAKEYIKTIKGLGKPLHRATKVTMGVASMEIYSRLDYPIDIAKGNLNIAVFKFNGFKYAIVQFNANNALPQMRNAIVSHLKKKFGVNAELYTTDTHAVNSLEFSANNVLGRHTKYEKLQPLIDQTMVAAISNMEIVSVYHGSHDMKKFKVWGPDTMENMITIAKSTYGITRLLVPIIVVLGFIAAAWIILVI